ncbi:MAG TPA: TVP38/TMEM64 family protein [Geomobilimonas sp.]|nr:TVP38/TMEM64 family protein [Geomobilimonas sp.]
MNGKKLAIALAIIAALVLFFVLDLGRFFTLEALKENRQTLLDYYRDHRMAMVAGFMGIYIVQTALSLPGAAILSLAAGAIFGAVLGTLYAVIGATVGATLALLVTRYLLRDAVLARFGPKLERINRELEERGVNYLLFLRLVPVFPFFLINLAAGLTRLPLRTFVIGTLVGIIPGGFVYCNAGASLATITSMGDVASPRVLGSFALLGLFALVPVLYGKMKKAGNRDPGSGTGKTV